MACENHSFCLFLIQKQMNGTLSKTYPKKNAFYVEVLSIFPINSRFQSLPREGEEPPLLLEITTLRGPLASHPVD